MKISARNSLKGTVTKIEVGVITSKVVIDLGNGNEMKLHQSFQKKPLLI